MAACLKPDTFVNKYMERKYQNIPHKLVTSVFFYSSLSCLLIYSINNVYALGQWSRMELSKDCLNQILAWPNTSGMILDKLFKK